VIVVELDFSLLERGGTCAPLNETDEMDGATPVARNE
jgi:hypothetical protein